MIATMLAPLVHTLRLDQFDMNKNTDTVYDISLGLQKYFVSFTPFFASIGRGNKLLGQKES